MSRPAHPSGNSILRKQSFGFFALFLIAWLAEVVGLPHYLFDEPLVFSWERVLLRSFMIVAVWLIVHLTTRRLLRRLHELEGFLLICSWCRKVGHQGDWLSMEDYFDSKFSTETSHGICPVCVEQQLQQHRDTLRCTAVTPLASPSGREPDKDERLTATG